MEARKPRTRIGGLSLLLLLATSAQAREPAPVVPAAVAAQLQQAQVALDGGDAARARDLFAGLLDAQPDLVAAKLGLGQAYLALDEYARAVQELETVLHLDDLPPGLYGQALAYAEAARRYQQGEPLDFHAHLRAGAGRYLPRDGADEDFATLRAAAGLEYRLDPANAVNASVEGRRRFNADSGNTWAYRGRAGYTHSRGRAQTHLELTGRRSRDASGDHWTDQAVSADWRYHPDPDNQWRLGAAWSRADYPESLVGQLNRNHHAGELSGGIEHASAAGDASVAINVTWGREWARGDGIDGDADYHGLDAELQLSLGDTTDLWVGVAWRHNRFSRARPGDDAALVTRRDDLYELYAGLAWSLAPGWSLEPELLYLRDRGNITANHYTSTELSLSLRKDF